MLSHKKLFVSILFIVILFVGAALRLYKFGDVPPGVNRDEAALGYTAYSILHTARDEYGRFLPLSFQSFGDWKLPLYIYISVLPVMLLGLNEVAVRLPSALAGIATIGLVFPLAQALFGNKKLSFLIMAVTALAPWSIHMSRVASEANVAVFLTTCAALLFLYATKGKHILFIPSAILFALTYFTYAGNYVFTTLLIIGLVLIYRKAIPKNKYIIIAGICFFVLSAFISLQTFAANHTKISGIGIFGDPSVVYAQITLPRTEYSDQNSLAAKFFNNKILFGSERFFQNYLNSFSPRFLFISGGTNHAHNIGGFGNMYIIEAPFLLLGVFFLFTQRHLRQSQLVLWWLLISPIPASITKDAPHSMRMLAVMPILPLITAVGIWGVYRLLREKSIYQLLFVGFVTFLYLLNLGIYLDKYYVHFPYNESQYWGIGYKKIVNLIKEPQFKNKNIIMSEPETSPYIYFLFYSSFDPNQYQNTAERYPYTSDGFLHVLSYGNKYTFRPIDWGKDIQKPQTLLIDISTNVPQSLRSNYNTIDILALSGQPEFTIVETK